MAQEKSHAIPARLAAFHQSVIRAKNFENHSTRNASVVLYEDNKLRCYSLIHAEREDEFRKFIYIGFSILQFLAAILREVEASPGKLNCYFWIVNGLGLTVLVSEAYYRELRCI